MWKCAEERFNNSYVIQIMDRLAGSNVLVNKRAI